MFSFELGRDSLAGLLATVSIWFCGGFETKIFQITPMFIYI